jgi:hypothetical protein
MTVNGFIAGPIGKMDWMKFPWTDDITEFYYFSLANGVFH